MKKRIQMKRLIFGRRTKISKSGEKIRFYVSYWFIGLPLLALVAVLPIIAKDQFSHDSFFLRAVQIGALFILGVIGLILLIRNLTEFDLQTRMWKSSKYLLFLPLLQENGSLEEIEKVIFDVIETDSTDVLSIDYELSIGLADREISIGRLPFSISSARHEARLFASFLGKSLWMRHKKNGDNHQWLNKESLDDVENKLSKMPKINNT